MNLDVPEWLLTVIREEIVRQHRDNERATCPAGPAFFEENVSPYLIAKRVLAAFQENSDPYDPDTGEITAADRLASG